VLRDGLDAGERILDAVVELVNEKSLRLLRLLALGDVDDGADIAEKIARLAEAWRSGIDGPSVLPVAAAQSVLQQEGFALCVGAKKRRTRCCAVVGVGSVKPVKFEPGLWRLASKIVPGLTKERARSIGS